VIGYLEKNGVSVKRRKDKKGKMIKMQDNDIWKILADKYPLIKRFENYFALLEALQSPKI
jgi:hypothetical protein